VSGERSFSTRSLEIDKCRSKSFDIRDIGITKRKNIDILQRREVRDASTSVNIKRPTVSKWRDVDDFVAEEELHARDRRKMFDVDKMSISGYRYSRKRSRKFAS
jgi:hypothetical protein